MENINQMSVEESRSTVEGQAEGQALEADGSLDQHGTYYNLLGVSPSASMAEIRHAYRELSKQYHPDTTLLPQELAIAKFQQLRDAYNILSNPHQRLAYDRKFRYNSNISASGPGMPSRPSSLHRNYSSSAYLDARDRPLSAGEVFALFIMGLSLVTCLLLAIVVGMLRGDTVSYSFLTPQTASPAVPNLVGPQQSTVSSSPP